MDPAYWYQGATWLVMLRVKSITPESKEYYP
jgi:hypothetical protein